MDSAWKVVPFLCFLLACGGGGKEKPKPTPSPMVEVTPAPTPSPTPFPLCPELPLEKTRLVCRDFSAWKDGRKWDCTLKAPWGDYVPEDFPNAQECQLRASHGEPSFSLEVLGGTLRLEKRTGPQFQNPNPFQFNLYGTGTGVLHCFVGEYDLCRGAFIESAGGAS